MSARAKESNSQDSVLPVAEAHLNRVTLWALLVSVSLISFSLLAFEITITRILSAVLSYHFVFLVLSLALLGLGAGGIFVYLFRRQRPSRYGSFSFLGVPLILYPLSIPFSVILMSLIAYLKSPLANVLLYGSLFFIPFFVAGVFLAAVYQTFPTLSSRIYGADLIGAAIGSFGVILILNSLGDINSSLFLALVASIAALLMATTIREKNTKVALLSIISFIASFGLLGSNLIGSYLPEVPVGTNPIQEISQPLSSGGKIIETRWSAFGRTDLVSSDNDTAWIDWMVFYLDGSSAAPMYRFNGDFANPNPRIASLKTDFPGYFPFLFLPENGKDNALIIGPGGGQDILVARMGGIDKITAVEINRDLVDMVRDYSWYNGGIYTDPDNVTVIVDEGRNFLKRQTEKYDIIMLSLPVTGTSRSLEGYALIENFIFTTQSINDYLEHLTNEGSLIITSHNQPELLRLFSTSLASLRENGISQQEAMRRIYIVGWDEFPTLVMRKTPFAPAELEFIHQAINQSGFALPETFNLNEDEFDINDMESVLRAGGLDISPVTDNSPFFYKFSLGLPVQVSLVLWSSIILLLLVTVVPLLYWKRKATSKEARPKGKTSFNKNTLSFIVLFLMLGIGFMLVEISLTQRLILFLGQPIVSLAVLLFSLLIGLGIGSIYSGRLSIERLPKALAIVCPSIVAMLLIYIFLLPIIFNQLLGVGLVIRLLATVILLAPLGFLMGFPFPSGLRLLRETKMENHIPWMWGINGISSVLGSAMAVVIAISLGFTQALIVAAACYFIVFLAFQSIQQKKV